MTGDNWLEVSLTCSRKTVANKSVLNKLNEPKLALFEEEQVHFERSSEFVIELASPDWQVTCRFEMRLYSTAKVNRGILKLLHYGSLPI